MILDPSYRDDMLEQLRMLAGQKPGLLEQHGVNVDKLGAAAVSPDADKTDVGTVERLWALYQKSVEEYDVDPDYAIKDALQDMFSISIESWNDSLPDSGARRKLVYIASPYAGDVKRNLAFAKAAGLLAVKEGCTPIMTHLMYPAILNDDDPDERALGMLMDMSLVALCDELWCFDANGVSRGMQEEIAYAEQHSIPVVTRHEKQPVGLARFLTEYGLT